MDRAKKIAEQLANIYNIKGKIAIELDFNDNDEYVYRMTFPMHVLGAKIVICVELLSADVDFDKSYQKLLEDAMSQVQAQLIFLNTMGISLFGLTDYDYNK